MAHVDASRSSPLWVLSTSPQLVAQNDTDLSLHSSAPFTAHYLVLGVHLTGVSQGQSKVLAVLIPSEALGTLSPGHVQLLGITAPLFLLPSPVFKAASPASLCLFLHSYTSPDLTW